MSVKQLPSVLDKIAAGLPPAMSLILNLAVPSEAKQQLDALLIDLASDVANRRDIQACTKVRRLLAQTGVDLSDYADETPVN